MPVTVTFEFDRKGVVKDVFDGRKWTVIELRVTEHGYQEFLCFNDLIGAHWWPPVHIEPWPEQAESEES